MIKRKGFSQKVREEVFRKYDGHCAYCGKSINYKWFSDRPLNDIVMESVTVDTFGEVYPAPTKM